MAPESPQSSKHPLQIVDEELRCKPLTLLVSLSDIDSAVLSSIQSCARFGALSLYRLMSAHSNYAIKLKEIEIHDRNGQG